MTKLFVVLFLALVAVTFSKKFTQPVKNMNQPRGFGRRTFVTDKDMHSSMDGMQHETKMVSNVVNKKKDMTSDVNKRSRRSQGTTDSYRNFSVEFASEILE